MWFDMFIWKWYWDDSLAYEVGWAFLRTIWRLTPQESQGDLRNASIRNLLKLYLVYIFLPRSTLSARCPSQWLSMGRDGSWRLFQRMKGCFSGFFALKQTNSWIIIALNYKGNSWLQCRCQAISPKVPSTLPAAFFMVPLPRNCACLSECSWKIKWNFKKLKVRKIALK